MYALISTDNKLLQFPLSLSQWRMDHPNISLPDSPTKQQLAEFGIVEVEYSPSPVEQYTLDYEETAELGDDGVWRQAWTTSPASESEIASRTEAKKQEVRDLRNKRLADCDWTQLPDAPVDAAVWAVYRQNLRDVTEQAGFPWEVVWPVKP